METKELAATANYVLTPGQLFEHWQGHRRLTRKVIEVFPEDKIFNYSIGGMRPFSEMVMEMIDIAGGGIAGVATGEWKSINHSADVTGELQSSKEELLKLWDRVTAEIDLLAPQVSPDRFQQVEMAFGAYEGTIYSTIFYFIDNEIHHRGQGYVYLRSLGVTPPPFWERD